MKSREPIPWTRIDTRCFLQWVVMLAGFTAEGVVLLMLVTQRVYEELDYFPEYGALSLIFSPFCAAAAVWAFLTRREKPFFSWSIVGLSLLKVVPIWTRWAAGANFFYAEPSLRHDAGPIQLASLWPLVIYGAITSIATGAVCYLICVLWLRMVRHPLKRRYGVV